MFRGQLAVLWSQSLWRVMTLLSKTQTLNTLNPLSLGHVARGRGPPSPSDSAR